MVKRLAKLRTADQTLGKLPGKLFHFTQRRQLRHFLTTHSEEFEEHADLFFEARLVMFITRDNVRELAEDPGILHCSASDQDTVRSRLAPSLQAVLDRRNVAVTGNRNRHGLLDLFDEIPIRKALVTLVTRASVDLNVLDAALLGHLRNLDDIDRRFGKSRPELQSERYGDRLLDLFQNRLKPDHVLQQPRSAAVLDDFWSGTPAVDVQYVGTDLFGHLGTEDHPL